MGTYELPRNVKGESRILFIFTTKALIYTTIGAMIGFPLYLVFSAMKMTLVAIGGVVVCAAIGFSIGTFKIPDSTATKFTTNAGGLPIDEVIKKGILFKTNKRNIYLYAEEEKEDEQSK